MSIILVTGGAGFIGSHVIKKLLERGDQVICVDDFNDYYSVSLKEDRIKKFLGSYEFPVYRVDIRNFDTLKKIFETHKIQKVCHLAARAGVRYSLQYPLLYEEVNVKGTLHLLELAKKYSLENFVFASSSSVYGANKKLPFSESDNVDYPISPYAATKKACELLAATYSYLYRLPCTGLRYFTVYGPWGRPDMALFLFTRAMLSKTVMPLYNYGKVKRDFTYIDDIVDGTISALDHSLSYAIFNLGNHHPVELPYLIQILEKNLGVKAYVDPQAIQPGDVEATYADIEKAQKFLNFHPRVQIEEGVKLFAEWYLSYYALP